MSKDKTKFVKNFLHDRAENLTPREKHKIGGEKDGTNTLKKKYAQPAAAN